MTENCLLSSKTAEILYRHCKDLPIIDYHCHLSPKEIYEDKVFDSLGQLWLGGDHYKWRLMRNCGVDEDRITGAASMKDKYLSYVSSLRYALGNPLYLWSHMELSRYFHIDLPICDENAELIWDSANEYIRTHRLSPVGLMTASGVETVCTTDDPADSLEWHKKIRKKNYAFSVLPSFRTDRMLLMKADGYLDYIGTLSDAASVGIHSLSSLKEAAEKRLLYFIENGCRFTDLGIPYFPDRIYSDEKADGVYRSLLNGADITHADYMGVLGNMTVYLARLCKKYGLVMQLHFAVVRNVNTSLYRTLGADCGGDCVSDPVSGHDLIRLLDGINEGGGMPHMILYTLNPSNAAQIASIAGAYPNVRLGTAWWFCDHKRGITEQMQIIAENGSLGSFLGMLTDSRSFLSYARHDYFRRILCSFVADAVDSGEYCASLADGLVGKVCYYNIKELMKGGSD